MAMARRAAVASPALRIWISQSAMTGRHHEASATAFHQPNESAYKKMVGSDHTRLGAARAWGALDPRWHRP
ncbi:hypothetical protein [Actinomadura sp. 9N215]|uniref:hypothetical protein n=1 Tax=Actinomadura sp. 9N215 TaxID=3375150 RepID=UPI0037909858